MKLLTLKIKNFKSITDKLIEFSNRTHITGRNASGKTTIQDAYTWLLFDRDSQDLTTCELRPIDQNGEYKNLDPVVVTAEIEHEGKTHKITKEMRTRVKGETITNTNKYIVDDLELTKGKYKDFIASITDELTFKLLSNPYYFSTLAVDDKRKLLTQLIDDPTEKVKKELPDLQELIEETKDTDLTDTIKQYTTSVNRQKKEIESIKSKLEEYVNHSYNEQEYKDLEYQYEQLQKEQQNEQQQKLAEISKITQQIARLEQQDDLTEPVVNQKAKLTQLEQQIYQSEEEQKRLQDTADLLRNNWSEVDTQLANARNHSICPTCKQPIPQEQLQQEINRLEEKQQEIIKKGVEYKEAIQKLTTEIEDLKNQYQLEVEKLTELENALKNSLTDAKQGEITRLRLRITEIENAENKALQEQIEQARQNLYNADEEKRKSERKDELEKQLAYEQEQIGNLERKQYNLIQIEETRNRILESELNALSTSGTRFKLFEKTNAGETKQTCKILVNTNGSLVEYKQANTGGKINAGLEIIKMLTAKNTSLPIWIDNTESIELKLDTDSQVIMIEVKKGEELKITKE